MVNIADLPELESRVYLGGRVQAVDIKAGTATVVYLPPAAMANPQGTLQGGYVLALLDDACGLLTWLAGGERNFSTAQASVNYLRPVPMSEKLRVDATIVHVGRQQAVVDAVLFQLAGNRELARGRLANLFHMPDSSA